MGGGENAATSTHPRLEDPPRQATARLWNHGQLRLRAFGGENAATSTHPRLEDPPRQATARREAHRNHEQLRLRVFGGGNATRLRVCRQCRDLLMDVSKLKTSDNSQRFALDFQPTITKIES